MKNMYRGFGVTPVVVSYSVVFTILTIFALAAQALSAPAESRVTTVDRSECVQAVVKRELTCPLPL